MSYETRYTLEYDDPDIQDELYEFLDDLAHMGELANGTSLDLLPWYEHEDHMLVVSEKYPNVEFILEGDGETRGDHWRKRFLNGSVETIHPVVTWPEWKYLELEEPCEADDT